MGLSVVIGKVSRIHSNQKDSVVVDVAYVCHLLYLRNASKLASETVVLSKINLNVF